MSLIKAEAPNILRENCVNIYISVICADKLNRSRADRSKEHLVIGLNVNLRDLTIVFETAMRPEFADYSLTSGQVV